MTWNDVGLPRGPGPSSVVVGGERLLLVFGDGRWWAIEDRCSHAGCAFSADGEIDGLVAVCNCHGSEFDVKSGDPLVMPATEPIRIFPVRRAGGTLEVEL